MEEAENILYIMDNCGEAVFDTLLVSLHQDKITLAVRGKPILNDITKAEVELSGFQNIRVIDTGDFTPGISLTASSEEFMGAYRSADLIIAKGQGNFENPLRRLGPSGLFPLSRQVPGRDPETRRRQTRQLPAPAHQCGSMTS